MLYRGLKSSIHLDILNSYTQSSLSGHLYIVYCKCHLVVILYIIYCECHLVVILYIVYCECHLVVILYFVYCECHLVVIWYIVYCECHLMVILYIVYCECHLVVILNTAHIRMPPSGHSVLCYIENATQWSFCTLHIENAIQCKPNELQVMHTDDPKEFWRSVNKLGPRKPNEIIIDYVKT